MTTIIREQDQKTHGKMALLDIFSGVGGFSLGLERSGLFKTVAFCEIDPYRRAVLNKHWPNVPCYHDVRELTAGTLRADGILPIDAICGGFPCQGISAVGPRTGFADSRSALWFEYLRLIRELRPNLVFLENSPNLRNLGLAEILGALASLGYDAWWDGLRASDVNAHHQRDRLFLVAYLASEQVGASGQPWKHDGLEEISAHSYGPRLPLPEQDSIRLPGWRPEGGTTPECPGWSGKSKFRGVVHGISPELDRDPSPDWSEAPPVPLVAYGIPNRVPRLKALGDAIVPQVAELLGRATARALTPEERLQHAQ